ncbi:hypothetical protein [Photobacterium profundum]|uniref:Uncharacterized protein n=1 Tax=Photobacterium profundum (strain SS9) TaxID=298386 RepID=Q6LRP5_PHOPR|nr:hypothetical protein [Photobacterium profundum]CAG20031.1 hypothetical protein PBPRA1620 [Photobacterium profundum SS9]
MKKGMYSHFFKIGMEITIGGKEATIAFASPAVILVHFKDTGIYDSIERHQAAQMYTDCELEIKQLEVLVSTKQALTLDEQAETNRKVEYVKYLLEQREPLAKESLKGLRAVAIRLGDRKAPSKSTLGRWLESYQQGGHHFMSLAPLKPGPKRTRIAVHFIDDIQEALDDRYLVVNPALFSISIMIW